MTELTKDRILAAASTLAWAALVVYVVCFAAGCAGNRTPTQSLQVHVATFQSDGVTVVPCEAALPNLRAEVRSYGPIELTCDAVASGVEERTCTFCAHGKIDLPAGRYTVDVGYASYFQPQTAYQHLPFIAETGGDLSVPDRQDLYVGLRIEP